VIPTNEKELDAAVTAHKNQMECDRQKYHVGPMCVCTKCCDTGYITSNIRLICDCRANRSRDTMATITISKIDAKMLLVSLAGHEMEFPALIKKLG
jgi:hypothetical protein